MIRCCTSTRTGAGTGNVHGASKFAKIAHAGRRHVRRGLAGAGFLPQAQSVSPIQIRTHGLHTSTHYDTSIRAGIRKIHAHAHAHTYTHTHPVLRNMSTDAHASSQTAFDKLNPASAKLYRILLKSIRASESASTSVSSSASTSACSSSSSSSSSSSKDVKDGILLQPPLNHRDYGSARLLESKKCMYWCSTNSNSDNNITTNKKTIDEHDYKYDVEHQIIAFFNWWIQYEYLTSSSSSSSSSSPSSNKKWIPPDDDDIPIPVTERIDDYLSDKMDVSSFESLLERSIYASSHDLRLAARYAFRLPGGGDGDGDGDGGPGGNGFLFRMKNDHHHHQQQQQQPDTDSDPIMEKKDVLELQRLAIEAIRLMEDQKDLWKRTSVSVDEERGLRVIATSGCIGTTAIGHLSPGQREKSRFSYRIRIENFNEVQGCEDGKAKSKIEHENEQEHEQEKQIEKEIETDAHAYQLLGRTWSILEEPELTSASILFSSAESSDDDDDTDNSKEVQVTVDAPTTGVVGHLPVIRPGEIFEYTSGCDLTTPTGSMTGCFHMASVHSNTKSAQVGDPVDALHAPKDKLFRMPVAPFRLIAN